MSGEGAGSDAVVATTTAEQPSPVAPGADDAAASQQQQQQQQQQPRPGAAVQAYNGPDNGYSSYAPPPVNLGTDPKLARLIR
eukprot:SAG22_NODE_10551_length_528_cov_1.170163_1_plen_81_part_10